MTAAEDLTFTVEVTYTDRSRVPDGRFRTFDTVVEVVAGDDTTATMVAAQMVDGIYSHLSGMVVATRITGVVV